MQKKLELELADLNCSLEDYNRLIIDTVSDRIISGTRCHFGYSAKNKLTTDKSIEYAKSLLGLTITPVSSHKYNLCITRGKSYKQTFNK